MSKTCSGCGAVFANWGALGNHGRYSETCSPVMRFWGKVDKSAGEDACWPYTGFIKWDGYGWFQHKRRWQTSSRAAWTFTHGDPGDLHVCHRCDNPRCCNPEHLFLGTHQDNMADMRAKGRSNGGFEKRPSIHPDRVRPVRK